MTASLFVPTKFTQLLLLSVGLTAASAAGAADQHWAVSGHGLKIDTPCAKTVTIEPASDLQNRVEVVAEAKHAEEIDQLKVNGGSDARIERSGSECWSPGLHVDLGLTHLGVTSFDPTLTLKIRVPAGTPIDLHEAGASDYRVGAVDGPLDLHLSGSGKVTAVNAKDVNLLLTGSGDTSIGTVDGAIKAKLSGSGDFTVAKVTSGAADLILTGSGHIAMQDGSVGVLNASLHGSGKLMAPVVTTINLESTGSGDVAVTRADGVVNGKLSGSGNLSINEISAPSVNMQSSGSSTVKIGPGRIGAVSVLSNGSSDFTVAATVGDVDLTARGSGDISIATVTGRIKQSTSGSGDIKIGGR